MWPNWTNNLLLFIVNLYVIYEAGNENHFSSSHAVHPWLSHNDSKYNFWMNTWDRFISRYTPSLPYWQNIWWKIPRQNNCRIKACPDYARIGISMPSISLLLALVNLCQRKKKDVSKEFWDKWLPRITTARQTPFLTPCKKVRKTAFSIFKKNGWFRKMGTQRLLWKHINDVSSEI